MSADRKFFIITGISGAGKSQALKCFEDFGFFCVDNMPVELVENFAELKSTQAHKRVALGMDIREGKSLEALPDLLKHLKSKGIDHRVLFLDASDAVVIHRFSETRHRHPLGLKVEDAIKEERKHLLAIKEIADKVIDTSNMTLGELKEALSQTLELTRTKEMTLSVVSFGYKYGIPLDADIVMDVRFLPNPNYVPSMRKLTGLNAPVQRYILGQPAARTFLEGYLKLIGSLLPQYVREGKSYLTIAIGCTGGRHRSVFITRYLAKKLRGSGHPIMEFHRDIQRGN
jgi:UPF0042 nucleotide-binding protein